jgi:hypothetical protein
VRSITDSPTLPAVAHRVLRPRGRSVTALIRHESSSQANKRRGLRVTPRCEACVGQRAPRGGDLVRLRKP